MRKLNDGIKEYQSNKREKSMKLLQDAIDEIHADEREVTRKELLEITGLSSGALSLPHLREVLKVNQVLQFKPEKEKTKQESSPEKSNRLLAAEINKLSSKLEDSETEVARLKERLNSSREENDNLKFQLERIRGKYQLALERLELLDPNETARLTT